MASWTSDLSPIASTAACARPSSKPSARSVRTVARAAAGESSISGRGSHSRSNSDFHRTYSGMRMRSREQGERAA
eukprot:scaffold315176_cov32-Tisochrysis_lutea.AAC.6